ncbi:flavodoxin family protein [Desulfogranum mediterraneum]|uniref:flavodoxin family protein n=1 Tax=Desulfogranum mediterraneum TaxID=160661 RepID=UPI0004274036|nr:NAD(P)H-dependent oxidoreductase [Desulfogranum mediterraneum]
MAQPIILNILGSPRKNGTTARIANSFVETATRRGAQVTSYYLNGLHYRGCQGCEGCHTRSERCILRDDATQILEGIYLADIVVFSAPIYFGDTCGQFKSFYDRMWSLIRPDYLDHPDEASRLPPGKTALLILSQADDHPAHLDAQERYRLYLGTYGFSVKTIMAAGLSMRPNTDISSYAAQAEQLARELIL